MTFVGLNISATSLCPLRARLTLRRVNGTKIGVARVFFGTRDRLGPTFVSVLSRVGSRCRVGVTSVRPACSLTRSFLVFSRCRHEF